MPKNQPRELIIATNERRELFAVRHLGEPGAGKITSRVSISECLFPSRVSVFLISESEGTTLTQWQFALEHYKYINDAEMSLQSLAEWKREQLEHFIRRGSDLFDQAVELPKPATENSKSMEADLKFEFAEWGEDVKPFLFDQLGETKGKRFETVRLPKAVNDSDTTDLSARFKQYRERDRTATLATRILAKLSVLHEFSNELSEAAVKDRFA